MNTIEIAAAAFGILGTLLLALNGKRAGWGFVAFLASNAGWIWFAIDQQHSGLLAQNIVFTLTSLLGIYVWFFKPRPHADAGDTHDHMQPGDVHTELLAAHTRISELEQLQRQDHLDAECFRQALRLKLIGVRTRDSLREYARRLEVFHG